MIIPVKKIRIIDPFTSSLSENEIKILIEKFQSNLKKNPESLQEEGRKMRAYCFSEPTEKLINKAFELE